MKIQFTLGGKVYDLSTEQVESALRGVEPERIYELAVQVDGRWFPPKQALVTPLGLSNRDINSHFAVYQLRKLGFATHDRKAQGDVPDAELEAPEADGGDRAFALELAVGLKAGTSASAADVLDVADEFLAWLGKE